jgi:hypothetical protein
LIDKEEHGENMINNEEISGQDGRWMELHQDHVQWRDVYFSILVYV